MKLSDVMTPNPEVVAPETRLSDAAAMMRKLDIGVLPVTQDGRLLGIVTDRDITVRATAEHKSPDKTAVRDVMTRDAACCHEDEDVREGARLMEERQIRRLPIVDREEHLIGIVSLGDIAVNAGRKLSGEVLEKVSEPGGPDR
jgi:CBS domain-containing protein